MNHDVPGAGALDYHVCQYDGGRLLFRGPPQLVTGDTVLCLGGTETFGKFVPQPWPDRLRALTGRQVVNLGCVNAGLDAFLGDRAVLAMTRRAAVTVVQVMGVQNASNRYYTVHPRRNDRFLGPTPLLRDLFAEVDFTEFHFTRHLVTALADHDPTRFAAVLDDLRAVWLARMRGLLAQAGGWRVVLWMADHDPGDSVLRADPWGVDAVTLDALADDCDLILRVPYSARARALGGAGMAFTWLETAVAQGLPGPAAHDEVATALAAALTTRGA